MEEALEQKNARRRCSWSPTLVMPEMERADIAEKRCASAIRTWKIIFRLGPYAEDAFEQERFCADDEQFAFLPKPFRAQRAGGEGVKQTMGAGGELFSRVPDGGAAFFTACPPRAGTVTNAGDRLPGPRLCSAPLRERCYRAALRSRGTKSERPADPSARSPASVHGSFTFWARVPILVALPPCRGK